MHHRLIGRVARTKPEAAVSPYMHTTASFVLRVLQTQLQNTSVLYGINRPWICLHKAVVTAHSTL